MSNPLYPLISVVVPVYNVENYIKRCIDSIINQTYSNIEIILVDDGSTDNSGDICDEFAKEDDRITVYHKANGGLSEARNHGIEHSHGTYISFIDSDDYISIDFISFLYSIIGNNDIAVCDFCTVHEYDTPNFKDATYSFDTRGEQALLDLIYYKKYTVYTWNKLYKRTLFDSIRYPKGYLYEDLATTYKLVELANGVVVSNAKKYAYIQRSSSIMGTTGYAVKPDKIAILKTMFDHFINSKYDNLDMINAGIIRYLLHDIYKMVNKRSLSNNIEYLSSLKNMYQETKKIISNNNRLTLKEKSIIKVSVFAPEILELLYRLRW